MLTRLAMVFNSILYKGENTVRSMLPREFLALDLNIRQ